jgi:hypothetical protein
MATSMHWTRHFASIYFNRRKNIQLAPLESQRTDCAQIFIDLHFRNGKSKQRLKFSPTKQKLNDNVDLNEERG